MKEDKNYYVRIDWLSEDELLYLSKQLKKLHINSSDVYINVFDKEDNLVDEKFWTSSRRSS